MSYPIEDGSLLAEANALESNFYYFQRFKMGLNLGEPRRTDDGSATGNIKEVQMPLVSMNYVSNVGKVAHGVAHIIYDFMLLSARAIGG